MRPKRPYIQCQRLDPAVRRLIGPVLVADWKYLTGCRSAYALERKYRPSVVHRADGLRLTTGGLRKVERGERLPIKAVLDEVEAQVPNAARVTTLPLWLLLDQRPLDSADIARLIDTLPRHVRALLVQRAIFGGAATHRARGISRGAQNRLAWWADVPSICAQVLLLRERPTNLNELEYADVASSLAWSLRRLLVFEPFFSAREQIYQHVRRVIDTDTFYFGVSFDPHDIGVREVLGWRQAIETLSGMGLVGGEHYQQGELLIRLIRAFRNDLTSVIAEFAAGKPRQLYPGNPIHDVLRLIRHPDARRRRPVRIRPTHAKAPLIANCLRI